MPEPTIGRIVHYTLPEGRSKGDVRPAIIVHVWGPEHDSSVQLQVFTDESNDGLPGVVWKTSVALSTTGESEFGRYHWPKVPARA